MPGIGAAGLTAAAARSQTADLGSSQAANGSILPYTSNTGTFIPARGRSFMKFSFDFPEPCVVFEDLQFGFRVFTFENVYGMDAGHMEVDSRSDELDINCTQLVWAGGQEPASGEPHAHLVKTAAGVELTVQGAMPQRVKSLTAIVRGIPRGRISASDGAFRDEHENEVLLGYPFSAGDLRYAGSLTTPLILIEASEGEYSLSQAWIHASARRDSIFSPASIPTALS